MGDIRPYFLDSSRTDRTAIRISVTGNLLIIAFCLAYVVFSFQSSGITWPYLVAALVAGYFFADFSSGLVHWGLDTWFDEGSLGRAVSIAREHHTHPQNILGYDFWVHATLGSAPSLVFIGPLVVVTALFPVSVATYSLMVIWLVTAACLFLATSFHNLAHRPAKSPLIRFAQSIHLVVPSDHHWVHHRGDQTIRYCAINGWANYVCDPLRVWRGLEWLVQGLTGAKPRRDDDEWQRRFKETGTVDSLH